MKHEESNIVTLEKKEKPLKERPRTRLRRALFSFFVVIIIFTAIYFASPLSKLGVVHFDGLVTISRSELISLMNIDEDELFLGISLSDISANIENHPIVSEVNISRSGINRLHIEIVEHRVAVCALVENEVYHILSDGFLIHENVGMRANCDELMIQGLTNEEVEADVPGLFVRQLMNVDPEIKRLIQIIEYTPAYGDIHRFSLFMIDGNTVIISSYTMAERLNLYSHFLSYIGPEQTGILRLDVGMAFIPHGN